MAAIKKQLVLKPLKKVPIRSSDFDEEKWLILSNAIEAISSRKACESSKEELYRMVEDLCMQKMGRQLYDRLSESCKNIIFFKLSDFESQKHINDSMQFVRAIDSTWSDLCEIILAIKNVFLYLDRCFAVPSGIQDIWSFFLEYFKSYLRQLHSNDIFVLPHLYNCVLAAVDLERNKISIDRDLIARIIRMLSLIDLYKSQLEPLLMESSRKFFYQEGLILKESIDLSAFLKHVDYRLLEAQSQCESYLHVTTRNLYLSIIDKNLFEPHISLLFDKGLQIFFDEDALEDIQRCFILLQRVNSQNVLLERWIAYIKIRGDEFLADKNSNDKDTLVENKSVIEDLLCLQDRMDKMLKKCFQSQESFKQGLKSALTIVLASQQVKVAERLARYCDRKLMGEKGKQEADLEIDLDKMMQLFKLIQGTDVFEKFYKIRLEKRLLLEKSYSNELEKAMLGKLKTECGSNFTSKLDGMFQDIELSKDVMNAYTTHITNLNVDLRGEPETHIHVLTMGHWPSSTKRESGIQLPDVCHSIKKRFEQFYNDRYQGRKLIWNFGLQRCVLVARFPSRKCELEVSFYQALVLLCFNNTDGPIPSSAFLSLTGLSEDELSRTLLSLSCGPIASRILLKTVNDGFHLNMKYTNKLYRVKINSIQFKESIEEIQKTHEEVFRERQYQVDAVIVRIMKIRKQLSHNQLMSEVMSQLKFPARASDLKSRIESLIERDYLERDKEQNAIYNYLA